ncbi:MAG: immunoglobulin domain-containing protein [Candidatus Didemnitutus sp.]|nr:immunoglobulin domain-containing protein [Candidatus Didemnitutus sp.]
MHTSPSRATWSRALVLPSRPLSARFARALTWALLPVVVLFAVLGAEAKIGAQYQLLLGNPSNAVTDAAVKNNYLIVRDQFAISYNDSLGQPNWVSWNLTSEDRGASGRTDAWSADPLLPAGFYRVQPNDYNDPGLSRGHMCPSADRTVTAADNTFTFLMSNMVPQTSHNNGGVWNNFEIETRNIAAAGNEVLVISGPSIFDGRRIASGVAAIPSYVWKVVVVVPVGTAPITERITTNTRVIAIKVPNVTSGLSNDWRTYLTSVNQIQQDTGLTFFTALSAQVASVLRTMIDGQPVVGAPVIETNPVAQSVAAGGSVTFSVTASGNAPLTYQWTFEGEPIAGATSATLTLNNVQLEHMGNYRVVVTNNVSTATSNPALLTVTGVAPVFLSEPMSQTANAGTNVVFSALAGGSPTLTYQWRKGGQPIEGATGATLTLTNVQAAAAGDYDVVATNSAGSATGGPASLEVTPSAPVILTQPATTSVGLGGTVTFAVTAIGTEPLAYVWRKAGVPIEGNASATTATLVLANVDASAVGSYDVVITNAVGTVTSSAASLTISSFSNGALNYTGGTYAQNFDTLTGTHGYDSDTAVSIAGNGPFQLTAAPFNGAEMGAWWMAKYDGTGANARYKIDNGSAVNGAIYSFGTIGAADRALGSVGSGSTRSRFGMILNNNTGQTLTEFTVTYVGEQWREGNSNANTLAFSYAVDGTDLNTGTFVSVAALNFTAPVNNPVDTTGAVLDGNAAANRSTVSATVTGLVWPAGTRLVLRWTDADDINNDDGLAIDDFVFTAANAGPVAPAVVSTTPASDATGISPAQPITVTFNQPVTLAADWFTLTSATQGALAATVSGGPTTYTITPSATLPVSDTITVNILADRVTEQGSGTLTMNEDYSFAFTTVVPVAPTIATHPAPQTVTLGGTATFAVGVNGTAPFTYQWRKGGQPIAGNASATTATLTLNNVQAVDAGSYDVVVSNLAGNVTSNAATLTVSTVVPSSITWNFTAGGAPSSALPTGVTGGTLTQGNNFGTTTMVTTTSASSGYAGASGSGNAGLTARIGALNKATDGSAYYQFTFTPPAGSQLYFSSLGFGSRSTSTGPQAYALFTSVDNYTTPIASGTMTANSAWVYHTPAFTATTGEVGAAVTFRLYGYNGGPNSPGSGTANWRIDDLSLSVAVEAVPPPSGFGTWLAEHFTEQERNDPQISGPDVKLTPDGLTNLMKYALGFAPRGPVGALPEPATADNDWTYTYTRPSERPDLTYTVQVSTDLVSWNSDGVEHVQVATGDGVETWRARHAGGAKLFFRLKVERP